MALWFLVKESQKIVWLAYIGSFPRVGFFSFSWAPSVFPGQVNWGIASSKAGYLFFIFRMVQKMASSLVNARETAASAPFLFALSIAYCRACGDITSLWAQQVRKPLLASFRAALGLLSCPKGAALWNARRYRLVVRRYTLSRLRGAFLRFRHASSTPWTGETCAR